ncbi:MAG: FtsQ-type POTRA domain-containing protein [Clostridia bacterium]|nr:FtsQ-type POTRA domain-containing protein [Clostridia bacterium]
MKGKGSAPKKRKLPLYKRAVISLVRALEENERKKQNKQQQKAARHEQAAQRKAGQRRPATSDRSARRNAQPRPAQQNAPGRRPPMTAEQKRRRAVYLRRMRLRKRIIRICAAVILLLIVILILSRTVLFKIQNIEITNPGDADYTASQIVSESGIVYGTQNLFSCDLDKVAKNIEQRLPYIGKAQVERDFPKSLRVTVTPTHASAAIAFGTGYLLIDPQGKMLEKVDTAPEEIPVLRCKTEFELNLGQYIGVSPNGRKADDQTKAATQMITLYKKIYAAAEQAQIQDITLIDIRDVRAITLMYQNRLTLHLGTQDSLEQKLKTAAKTIAVESDASRTRTGAIDLTSIPYVYSRDTYETIGEEASTEVTEPESETEKAE